jgi:hypothetical protein
VWGKRPIEGFVNVIGMLSQNGARGKDLFGIVVLWLALVSCTDSQPRQTHTSGHIRQER